MTKVNRHRTYGMTPEWRIIANSLVAVFLRVKGHPPRRTGRRQHDPNTYAGQVLRRLTETTRMNKNCREPIALI
jgi:hypothetical protein